LKKTTVVEEIDVQSRFSEGDLEFVSKEDSYEMLNSFDSYAEYNKERYEND
jgi:hypothetical protein